MNTILTTSFLFFYKYTNYFLIIILSLKVNCRVIGRYCLYFLDKFTYKNNIWPLKK